MSTEALKVFPDPPARIHLIGVKGVGMTALAELLQGQGYRVSGSDTSEVFATDAVLREIGLQIADGFNASHVGRDVAAVVYTSAYGRDNVERQAAHDRGIPEWSYAEVVGHIMAAYSQRVAVAGSHGKTTTTALLARMLEEGGLDPTVIVGSTVLDWRRNGRLGRGSWFVIEADEYQNKFQYYTPRFLLITNVDYDHPDFFPTPAAYESVFIDFVRALPPDGLLVIWADDPAAPRLTAASPARIVTYGTRTRCDWRLADVRISSDGTSFTVYHGGNIFGRFQTTLVGEHYALDAVGAIALAKEAGVDVAAMDRALRYFRGTSRRLEHKGEYMGVTVLDDYAHHPAEIRATLKAIRLRYPDRRVWCVFQAHTFSRTAVFLKEFGDALSLADRVVVLPIYASAREAQGKISHGDIVAAVNAHAKGKAVMVSSHDEGVRLLERELGVHDLLLTMGAGDVWRVGAALLRS